MSLSVQRVNGYEINSMPQKTSQKFQYSPKQNLNDTSKDEVSFGRNIEKLKFSKFKLPSSKEMGPVFFIGTLLGLMSTGFFADEFRDFLGIGPDEGADFAQACVGTIMLMLQGLGGGLIAVGFPTLGSLIFQFKDKIESKIKAEENKEGLTKIADKAKELGIDSKSRNRKDAVKLYAASGVKNLSNGQSTVQLPEEVIDELYKKGLNFEQLSHLDDLYTEGKSRMQSLDKLNESDRAAVEKFAESLISSFDPKKIPTDEDAMRITKELDGLVKKPAGKRVNSNNVYDAMNNAITVMILKGYFDNVKDFGPADYSQKLSDVYDYGSALNSIPAEKREKFLSKIEGFMGRDVKYVSADEAVDLYKEAESIVKSSNNSMYDVLYSAKKIINMRDFYTSKKFPGSEYVDYRRSSEYKEKNRGDVTLIADLGSVLSNIPEEQRNRFLKDIDRYILGSESDREKSDPLNIREKFAAGKKEYIYDELLKSLARLRKGGYYGNLGDSRTDGLTSKQIFRLVELLKNMSNEEAKDVLSSKKRIENLTQDV